MLPDQHETGKANLEILEDVDEDPVTKAIDKTGCLQLHYAVQECMSQYQDWRKCQSDLTKFRKCIEESQKNSSAK